MVRILPAGAECSLAAAMTLGGKPPEQEGRYYNIVGARGLHFTFSNQVLSRCRFFTLRVKSANMDWPNKPGRFGFHEVVVIDVDIGGSGGGVQERAWFWRILGGGV